MEELEDILLYDEAKKNDNGERVPIEEAFKIIEDKRKNRKMLAGRIAYEAELVKNESLHVLSNFDPFE